MSKSSIAQAYVQILPTTDALKMNLSKAMNPHLEQAGVSGGKTLGAALSKTIAALGIGKAIKDSLNLGAELQQNLGGAEAVFGSFADSVKEKAKSAFTEMGLSASDYMATANKMGSLFQGSGLEQQRALELTTKAMQRASDVASVMGLDMSMAMESIAGAAKGNFTMMDNLSVTMNATTLAAYALEKGVNFKWETASNAEKAELAMQMFFDRTAQYAGNFKRESEETFSGAFGAMKSAAQNVLGNLSLGEDIKPSLDDLLKTVETFATKNLAPMLGNVMKGIPTIIESGLSFAIKSLNIAKDNVQTFTAQGISIAKELATSVISAAPYIAESALHLVAEFGRTLLETDWAEVASGFISDLRKSLNLASGEIFGSDKGIIDAVLDAIVEGLPQIANKGFEIVSSLSQGIIKSIPKVTASIEEVMSHVLDAVVKVSQEIPLLVEQFLPMLVKLGTDIVSGLDSGILQKLPEIAVTIGDVGNRILDTLLGILPKFLTTGMEFATGLANGIIGNIPSVVASVTAIIRQLVATVMEHLPEIVSAGKEMIGELKTGFISNIPDLLKQVLPMIKDFTAEIRQYSGEIVDAGIELILDLVDGLIVGLPELIEYVPEIISNIANVINDNMPKILKAGIDIIIALGKGLVQSIPDLLANMGNILKALADVITAINWLDFGVKILQGIGKGLLSMRKSLAKELSISFSDALSWLKDLPGHALSWGADMISGFVKGILGSVGKVINAVKNVAAAAASYLHFSRPDVGPLREYEKWMPDFMEGLAKSIRNNKYQVSNAISEVSGMMAGGLNPLTLSGNVNAGSATQGGSIEQLLSLVAGLSDKIDRMEIRLDSGELVGGIKTKMNKALGDQSALEARGVA